MIKAIFLSRFHSEKGTQPTTTIITIVILFD